MPNDGRQLSAMIATLCWKEDEREVEFSSEEELILAIKKIAELTRNENGIAAVLRKPSGQEMTVISTLLLLDKNGCGTVATVMFSLFFAS